MYANMDEPSGFLDFVDELGGRLCGEWRQRDGTGWGNLRPLMRCKIELRLWCRDWRECFAQRRMGRAHLSGSCGWRPAGHSGSAGTLAVHSCRERGRSSQTCRQTIVWFAYIW